MGGGPSRRRLTTSTLGLDYFSTPIMVYFSAPIDRAEFLQCLGAPEPLHGSLSSSKRLMRVFRPIVEATTNLVAIDVADLAHRSGIRAKPVGDDVPRAAIFLHDALQKVQRRSLVPLRGDHRFQNLAFVIGSPPEIAELPLIFTKTSSKCQRHWGKRRTFATRLFRISAANIGPNRFHQNRIVSWLMSIPRSASRSSTLRSDSGYLTYIITTSRITSGELLKYRNGLLMTLSYHGERRPPKIALTMPAEEFIAGETPHQIRSADDQKKRFGHCDFIVYYCRIGQVSHGEGQSRTAGGDRSREAGADPGAAHCSSLSPVRQALLGVGHHRRPRSRGGSRKRDVLCAFRGHARPHRRRC